MATADGTVTLSVVPSPPAEPPVVGLIPSLGASGGPYLDPPDTFADLTLPPLNEGEQAITIRQPSQRWEGGLQFLPEQFCSSATVQDPCAPDLSAIPANPDVIKAMPFLVWAGFTCSTFGWEAEDPEGRALRAILAVESKQIAHELWTGTRAKAAGWPNAFLAGPLSDTLSAAPLAPAHALDVLEQALGDCSNGQRGVIHCTRQLGSFWSGLGGTLRTAGGLIMTYAGTIIIPDAGYDGSGPNGQPAVSGSQWAYGTLMPQVRRGAIEAVPDTWAEAVNRSVNTVAWRAWRPAAVSFPLCCRPAVECDLPLALEAGVS